MNNIKTSKDLASAFLKNLEELAKKNKNHEVFPMYEKWKSIIGNKKLADNCELQDIKNNTLIIKTNHTGWSQQIQIRKKTIIRNINKMYPSLKIVNISIIIEDSINIATKVKSKEELTNSEDNSTVLENFNEEESIPKDMNPELEKALKKLKKRISSSTKKK